MAEVLVALGANMPGPAGTPRETLEAALALLAATDRGGMRVVARSRWYATPAWPPGSGPAFVNGAAVIETALGPAETLARLHAVEAALGRERSVRWAPRVCDLDLLAHGDAVLPDAATAGRWAALGAEAAGVESPDRLVLPHPRMQERAFVLVPLAEIAPGWRHPITGLRVDGMLAALPAGDRAAVAPLDPP